MQLDKLKINLKRGDINTAAKMIDITEANAYKALKRPLSKWHKSMLEALELIQSNREQLIENGIPNSRD